MFSQRQAKAYCCEVACRIAGYEDAVASKERYSIHHRFEDMGLSSKDLIEMGLYYKRPACELIFLPNSHHSTLHNLSRWQDARNIEKFSKWSKTAWGDPEFRKKQKDHLRVVQDTTEYRVNLSNGIKRALESTEARKKRSKQVKCQWDNSPERRKHAREITKALWQNPEYREKVISPIKATIQRKKMSSSNKS